jgi:hypothetical protein
VGLKAASELHRLIAKDQEQLAELVHKEFELPLQRNLATHQKRINENERIFDKTMRKMQDEISKTESKMLKGSLFYMIYEFMKISLNMQAVRRTCPSFSSLCKICNDKHRKWND